MSDSADEADGLQELQIQAAISRQREQAANHEATLRAATGFCLNCDEVLDDGRFCDADCRDDFERRTKARSK